MQSIQKYEADLNYMYGDLDSVLMNLNVCSGQSFSQDPVGWE